MEEGLRDAKEWMEGKWVLWIMEQMKNEAYIHN